MSRDTEGEREVEARDIRDLADAIESLEAAVTRPRLRVATALLAAMESRVWVTRASSVDEEWQRGMCRSALALADMLIEEADK